MSLDPRAEFNEGELNAIMEDMNIPHSVSDAFRKLSETAFYLARGARVGSWQGDLEFYNDLIQKNPENSPLRFLLAATLEGIGERDGAIEQYVLAAELTQDPLEKMHILERSAECAEKTGNYQQGFEARKASVQALFQSPVV